MVMPSAAFAASSCRFAKTLATTRSATTTLFKNPGPRVVMASSSSSQPKQQTLTFPYLTDLVEYFVELVFLDRSQRDDHWKLLTYFWGLHPSNEFEYGRLYAKVRLAELLHTACRSPACDTLWHWTRPDWLELLDDVKAVHAVLLRADVHEIATGDNENSTELDRNLLDPKYHAIVKMMEIAAAVAPLRQYLETDKGDFKHHHSGGAVVGTAALNEFGKYVEKTQDNDVKEVLDKFLAPVATSKKRTAKTKAAAAAATPAAPSYALASDVTLETLLQDKVCDLQYLQDKLEGMVHKWAVVALGSVDPVLIRCKYRMAPGSAPRAMMDVPKASRGLASSSAVTQAAALQEDENLVIPGDDDDDDEDRDGNKKPAAKSDEELAALRSERRRLQEQGDDPLEESRQMAETATRRRPIKPELTSPEAIRTRDEIRKLTISNDLEEDDEEEEAELAKLSGLPIRLSARKRQRLSNPDTLFRGHAPDEGLFDNSGKVTKRRKWTAEEKTAVKEGVKKHGIGKWVQIKDEYAEILHNRTSVQIKDVWRTMKSNSEVETGESVPV